MRQKQVNETTTRFPKNMSSQTKIETPADHIDPDLQLVDGPTLLQRLFPEQCRPTHRWLQTQIKRKAIPSTKIGHLRFYIPAAVRGALEKRTIGPRSR